MKLKKDIHTMALRAARKPVEREIISGIQHGKCFEMQTIKKG